MSKLMRGCVSVAIASLFLGASLALAQDKVKGPNDKPPGWEKGEKKGWEGEVPPGQKKKSELKAKGASVHEPGKESARHDEQKTKIESREHEKETEKDKEKGASAEEKGKGKGKAKKKTAKKE